MRTRILLLSLAAVGLMGAAPEAPATFNGAPTFKASEPYLSGASAPDTQRILPPAPLAGSARYGADRTTYLETRILQGTPRWDRAAADADESAIVKDFACAVGVDLTGQPKLTAMLGRVRTDVRTAVNTPKEFYKRQRPYLIDKGPTCVEQTKDLSASADYPSGHTTWGWTVGLLLAELAPDKANDIMVRARSFGESRLVCGVHNLSAIDTGRMNSSIVVAALHGNPPFRKDLEAVRKEVEAARKTVPATDPAACAGEMAVYEKTPY
jgi:acid phosphatase (class A)